MTENKKILFLDIDGTLVNSKKEITPKTLEALIDIQKEGHIVCLASGRPYPGILPYVKKLRLDEFGGYVLAFNGGKIVDCKTMKVVYEKPLSNKFTKIVYDYALKNGLGMVTYQDNRVITGTEIDDYMSYEARLNYMDLVKVDDFIGLVDYDPAKFLLTADPEKSEQFEKELAELLGPDVNVFRSEPYFIEITNKAVDKALSIEGLLPILGLKREQSICCGDGFNDLTMVRYGGIGVAMGNAQEIVKENADYITASCDEDGLVEVIDKFIRG